MKKEKLYTRDTLIKVLESYARMIDHNSEYPTVVLSDIRASIKSVLEKVKKEEG